MCRNNFISVFDILIPTKFSVRGLPTACSDEDREAVKYSPCMLVGKFDHALGLTDWDLYWRRLPAKM